MYVCKRLEHYLECMLLYATSLLLFPLVHAAHKKIRSSFRAVETLAKIKSICENCLRVLQKT